MRMNRNNLFMLAMFLLAGCQTGNLKPENAIRIGPFAAGDGARHQGWIQEKMNAGAGQAQMYRFAPGEYLLSDPRGLRVPPDSVLMMDGARFVWAESIGSDGQTFLLENVSNVSIEGGMILGCRDRWEPGVNVAGVRILGASKDIRIAGLTCENLSSNAVGVFGAADNLPIRNVALTQVAAINCCNYYGDYLQPGKGPAPGSAREDQGSVAMYFVDGWLVDGCRFERSQSDGTHFFHSPNGRFVNSVVAESKMGGYFLEGCENVLASGNLIRENGSRGVTIERDSKNCTLSNNLVTRSGREGLWAPDVSGVIVSGNIFKENGQKDDGERDCEIRVDNTSEYATETQDLIIEGNIFHTNAHQTAAIFLGKGVREAFIGHNTFRGAAPSCYDAASAP